MTVALQPRIVEIDVHEDARWAEFVARHPEGLIYHHPSWLAAIAREYGQKCRAWPARIVKEIYARFCRCFTRLACPLSLGAARPHPVSPRCRELLLPDR